MALCVAISVISWLIDQAEAAIFSYATIEAIVLAILIGIALRTVWIPSRMFRPGIVFTAQFVLEVAIVLLGDSLDLRSLEALGFALLAAVFMTTAMTLGLGVVDGRFAGLSGNLAILIAGGNAICGNSALAAVAPVIRAKRDEVASAISLTAVLGVFVVLLRPDRRPGQTGPRRLARSCRCAVCVHATRRFQAESGQRFADSLSAV